LYLNRLALTHRGDIGARGGKPIPPGRWDLGNSVVHLSQKIRFRVKGLWSEIESDEKCQFFEPHHKLTNMRAFLLLTMIMVAYDCTPQRPVRERQPDLFGKVKNLKETTCEAKDVFGEVTKGSIISKLIYKYDEDGKEIEWNQYDKQLHLC
jgi:hypothetical protein